jgi:hypothetical protein
MTIAAVWPRTPLPCTAFTPQVASQSKDRLKTQSTDALPLVRDVPNSGEPHTKLCSGFVKY